MIEVLEWELVQNTEPGIMRGGDGVLYWNWVSPAHWEEMPMPRRPIMGGPVDICHGPAALMRVLNALPAGELWIARVWWRRVWDRAVNGYSHEIRLAAMAWAEGLREGPDRVLLHPPKWAVELPLITVLEVMAS